MKTSPAHPYRTPGRWLCLSPSPPTHSSAHSLLGDSQLYSTFMSLVSRRAWFPAVGASGNFANLKLRGVLSAQTASRSVSRSGHQSVPFTQYPLGGFPVPCPRRPQLLSTRNRPHFQNGVSERVHSDSGRDGCLKGRTD